MIQKTFFLLSLLLLASCTKDEIIEPTYEPKLIVVIKVDPNQERLGNLGQPVSIPSGNAGQNPKFNLISAHYLEFAPNANTALGKGTILYHAPEKTIGGITGIDFDQSKIVTPGETFLEIPLKNIPAGSYEWVRLSLSYQNYDVVFNFAGLEYTGTLASFVGYNTFLNSYKIKTQSVNVNDFKKQGYWAFETAIVGNPTQTGQSAGTTVPNPIASTSPIPAGSCVVTGKFSSVLQISSSEKNDIYVTMSLSINKSFEWKDVNGNGKWDVESSSGENVVDMGLRGLIPTFIEQ